MRLLFLINVVDEMTGAGSSLLFPRTPWCTAHSSAAFVDVMVCNQHKGDQRCLPNAFQSTRRINISLKVYGRHGGRLDFIGECEGKMLLSRLEKRHHDSKDPIVTTMKHVSRTFSSKDLCDFNNNSGGVLLRLTVLFHLLLPTTPWSPLSPLEQGREAPDSKHGSIVIAFMAERFNPHWRNDETQSISANLGRLRVDEDAFGPPRCA